MRKAITIHLKNDSSYEIRNSLIKQGFQFFTYKSIENRYEPIDEEHLSQKNLFLGQSVELVCIYNKINPSEAQIEELHALLLRVHRDKGFIKSTVHTTNGL